MKFTENKNAPNCRILAKQYLKCRMDNQLMEKSDWDSLGLVNLPGENDVELDHHHHYHLNNNNTKADGKVVVVIAIRIWLILLTIILGQVPVQSK